MRKGRIIVHPYAITTAGLLILSEPYLRISSESSDEEYGVAVLRALKAAGLTVAHPAQDEWELVTKPFLQAAGISSWRTYMNGAVCCNIDQIDSYLVFTATENDGKGFEKIEGEEERIQADVEIEKIGCALRRGLRASC